MFTEDDRFVSTYNLLFNIEEVLIQSSFICLCCSDLPRFLKRHGSESEKGQPINISRTTTHFI